jgi:hypothetical protein
LSVRALCQKSAAHAFVLFCSSGTHGTPPGGGNATITASVLLIVFARE